MFLKLHKQRFCGRNDEENRGHVLVMFDRAPNKFCIVNLLSEFD